MSGNNDKLELTYQRLKEIAKVFFIVGYFSDRVNDVNAAFENIYEDHKQVLKEFREDKKNVI